jgi:hypothetical protein
MNSIPSSLVRIATIHGVDCTAHVDAATGDALTTLAAFHARSAALRAQRKALKDGDTTTADDCAASADAMREDNRADVRVMLSAARSLSRRERALMVSLACRGV